MFNQKNVNVMQSEKLYTKSENMILRKPIKGDFLKISDFNGNM